MAAIDEMDLSDFGPLKVYARQVMNELFWNWYDLNKERRVTTLKVWFIRKSVYVRDLHSVFVLLVGDHP